jgi:hypothetical protein
VNAGFPIDDVVNNDLVITASFGYTSVAWAEVTGLLSAGQLRHGTGPRGKVLIEVSAG